MSITVWSELANKRNTTWERTRKAWIWQSKNLVQDPKQETEISIIDHFMLNTQQTYRLCYALAILLELDKIRLAEACFPGLLSHLHFIASVASQSLTNIPKNQTQRSKTTDFVSAFCLNHCKFCWEFLSMRQMHTELNHSNDSWPH